MLVREGYSSIFRNSPPAPADIAITGLCFQPKALIVYIGPGAPGSYGSGGGFRPPAAYFNDSFEAAPGSASGLDSHWDSGTVAYGAGQGGSLGAGYIDAQVVSYDADGFTLHFPHIGYNNFYWIAFGGENLEAHAGSFTIPAGSTSPLAVTGVGFQPDFLFCHTTADSGVAGAVSMGMASSPSDQAAMSGSQGVFALANHTLLNGYLLCPRLVYSADVDYQAQLASFDADGFTVDLPYNTGNSNTPHYLALKDPDSVFKVGVETQGTTGTKATSGVGFQPGGGVFIGSYKTVDNDFTYAASPGGTPMFSIGGSDGLLNQSCETEFNTPGGFGGHDQNWFSDIDCVLAVGNTPTPSLLARGEMDTWDSDGFTLDWTISDGVARYFIYGVFETDRIDPCASFRPQIYRWLKR